VCKNLLCIKVDITIKVDLLRNRYMTTLIAKNKSYGRIVLLSQNYTVAHAWFHFFPDTVYKHVTCCHSANYDDCASEPVDPHLGSVYTTRVYWRQKGSPANTGRAHLLEYV